MAKKIISRDDPENFLRHCYITAMNCRDSPEALAIALASGIDYFEVEIKNGKAEIKTVLIQDNEE